MILLKTVLVCLGLAQALEEWEDVSEMEDSSAWDRANPYDISEASFHWEHDSDEEISRHEADIEFELPLGGSVYVHALGFDLYSDWEESDGCFFEVDSDFEDKLTVIGIVDPFEGNHHQWACGALVQLTSDAETDDEITGELGADYRAMELHVTITVVPEPSDEPT